MLKHREKCYRCFRPKSSCMCDQVRPVHTQTLFIILMHPKEQRHIRNGTGHLTHLSLPNSRLFVGIDFSTHQALNTILKDPQNSCYILYPSDESIVLNNSSLGSDKKQLVFILIDATWASAKKMLRVSKNLHTVPKVSFTHTKTSNFQIKEQPESYCLSTIETTQTVLELLNQNHDEKISQKALEVFLHPFDLMVQYQLSQIENKIKRFKIR